MRKLPPLNAVRAFEAAARHVSFTKAAEELFVTHGAVSRQVARLEEYFGTKLFRRTPSQLTLTDAGQLYLTEVTALLDRLALVSMHMIENATPTALRISAPPTFTMRWLIGRLSTFQKKRPEVELRVTTSVAPIGSNEFGFDVGIRGVASPPSGWERAPFMTEFIVPVCHVDLPARSPLMVPGDLASHTLITYLTEPYDWPSWFEQAGAPRMAPTQSILRFEQMYFALHAVQERMGIAMLPLFLVIDDLIEKRLCVPFGTLGLRRREYGAFYRADCEARHLIGSFCEWLREGGKATEKSTNEWALAQGWKL
ncbi:LysR substrate-binding domain-containing protein [Methylobacterium gnaphalii]|uniref:DNA-binding transcriptional activator GcvA n=1 Tax=Methylobacterium gnaphalii TaxID=1010610 RepID=A0A512JRI0_9HYPH|nr:LysR substrate-binding domain-containing protein [Methylobacterium gnaphalii]GEP12566.1 DNA-binding transcriptional activator GcvA [Methylobacterium gnaphalii]GLS47183.1 DNA-binding transcriptional activator GcvA [Methylobacterium gnaphalii]